MRAPRTLHWTLLPCQRSAGGIRIPACKHHQCERKESQIGVDLIVTMAIGTPYAPTSIKRDLKTLCNRTGVPPVTTHGLRHQAATVMLQAGTSPALVALKLGHADIGTTVDRYGHLSVGDQAGANAATEAFLERGRMTV